MTFAAWFYLFFLLLTINEASKLYTVVAPGTLRPQQNYSVAVSVHNVRDTCEIQVGLSGPLFNPFELITLKPNSTAIVTFEIPRLPDADYKLKVDGLQGILFTNQTKLNFEEREDFAFIQTDKATYKPGDLIQFRVMFLDARTRPAEIDSRITVIIKDGAGNDLKQWDYAQLVKGVFSGSYQLSEQPVLGVWSLVVEVSEGSTTHKSFEVAKYVLPNFEVKIITAKDVARTDSEIHGAVQATYTFGKDVKGNLTLKIAPADAELDMDSDSFSAEKNLEIDGKAQFSFDLLGDMGVSSDLLTTPPLSLTAIVEEQLTGNRVEAQTTINLHKERFVIESVDRPDIFYPFKSVEYKVAIKNVDGTPVLDKDNKVSLFVGSTQDNNDPLYLESLIDELGIATFRFSLPNPRYNHYAIACEYLNVKQHFPAISRYRADATTNVAIKLILRTKRPRLKRQVFIEVQSNQTIPYLVYAIIARGNVFNSSFVEVPPNEKVHTFSFIPSIEMIPHIDLFVHFTTDDDFRFEEMSIDIEEVFENTITIHAPNATRPSKNIKLHLEVEPESYVGLLAVDQSVLLLKSGNDFSKKEIFKRLDSAKTKTPLIKGFGRYPGKKSGLITLTNAHHRYHHPPNDYIWTRPDDGKNKFSLFNRGFNYEKEKNQNRALWNYATNQGEEEDNQTKEPLIRKVFPETWFFLDIENVDGSYTLNKKIPDTITSWMISGFSLNPKLGFGLTESFTKMQVFQPFFIATNLPYSVKKDEIIAIPVIVFNYLDKELEAEVTLDNADGEYEFLETSTDSKNLTKRSRLLRIPANAGRNISFVIRPKKIGAVTLKIAAISALAGDAVHKILKVEPEGLPQFVSRSVFLTLGDTNPRFSRGFSLDIPKDAVPDSEHIEVSAMSDVLAPTTRNLGKLVRLPDGCGEQNMVGFVPNIWVLKHLRATKSKRLSIEERAKKYLEIGYQRELSYKLKDGSFSAFGEHDKVGSTWLTAYVVRSFLQARQFIKIDSEVVNKGLQFLERSQEPDGSFAENGKLVDFDHGNSVGLTAFTLLAFLEDKILAGLHKYAIESAVEYLLQAATISTDTYSLALAAYALRSAGNPKAAEILERLEISAKNDGEFKWWSNGNSKKDVELTSYVLLAKMEDESAEQLLPAIKWLVSKRNSFGGFTYTQDTVLGLQALTQFAQKSDVADTDIEIALKDSAGVEKDKILTINQTNGLDLPTHVLGSSFRSFNVEAKGRGSSVLQLSYNYNVMASDNTSNFIIKPTVKNDTKLNLLNLEVCVTYKPMQVKVYNESNMAIMEVSLPSGYVALTKAFGSIQDIERVKRIETKKSDTLVLIYFDGLTIDEEKCIPILANRAHDVAELKPAAVKIYDYYASDRPSIEYYQVDSSLCDICEDSECYFDCENAGN